jgi:hypothetical protein
MNIKLLVIFISMVALVSCEEDQALTPNPSLNGSTQNTGGNGSINGGNSGGNNLNYFFDGKVDGVALNLEVGVNNYDYSYSTSQSGAPNNQISWATGSEIIETDDSFDGTTDFPAVEVSYNYYFDFPPFDNVKVLNATSIGSLNFSVVSDTTWDTPGAIVRYRDVNGVNFSTADSLFVPANNSFTIESIDSVVTTTVLGKDVEMIVQSKFNCTLYSEDGDSVKIEDGAFRSVYLVQ